MDMDKLLAILPYIVSVVCSIIAGATSYAVARKQTKSDFQRLEKQYELDIEKEREKFAMEKERIEIEHQHQLELLQKENENSIGATLANTFLCETMKMPEFKQQLSDGMRKGKKKQ